MHSFEALKRFHRRYHQPRLDVEMNLFSNEPSLRDAIRRAGLAQNRNSRKFRHQSSLKPEDLRKAAESLLAAEREISYCKTFDELYRAVRAVVSHIWINAELYCYDTALRIGFKLGLKPDKIYLHCGTRIGATKLGLNTKADTLDMASLPLSLRSLEPSQVEDFLCTCKDKFDP